MLAHSLSPRPTSLSHSSLLSPPSTHTHRSRAPPTTTTTSGGERVAQFFSPFSTPWGCVEKGLALHAMGDVTKRAFPPPRPTRALPRHPSPPPRETRARRASASLFRMITHLRPTSALALARPARDAPSPPPQERNPCVTTYGPGPAGSTPAQLYPRDYTVGQDPPPAPWPLLRYRSAPPPPPPPP